MWLGVVSWQVSGAWYFSEGHYKSEHWAPCRNRVAGSNPTGGEILPEPKRRFIAQSLSCSPFHRLEMTEILLKRRKTLTHPSIHPSIPVATIHLRDMTENLLKAMLKRISKQTVSLMVKMIILCCVFRYNWSYTSKRFHYIFCHFRIMDTINLMGKKTHLKGVTVSSLRLI